GRARCHGQGIVYRRSPHASRPLADGGGACGGDFGGLDVTVHRAARGRRASVAAGIAVGALLLAVPAPALAQQLDLAGISDVSLRVGGSTPIPISITNNGPDATNVTFRVSIPRELADIGVYIASPDAGQGSRC